MRHQAPSPQAQPCTVFWQGLGNPPSPVWTVEVRPVIKPTARTYRHKDEDWKAAAPGAQSLSNLRPRLGGGPGNNNVGNAAALLSFS